ncbi:MAG: diaminopimelate epimerase [Bacteroidota bacterium]|nr:diaminopimelate epimerase [Bacteroidota bacterium]
MIKFHKYQGTGNDFIIIDNRENIFDKSNNSLIENLCDRRFGIGADGLILLEMKNNLPQMVYYNSDGKPSSMCGNGGRCFAAFCKEFDLVTNNEMTFEAVDGKHEVLYEPQKIKLKMNDVPAIKPIGSDFELNTGSPHYIVFEQHIDDINIIERARQIRYNNTYKEAGINVNFVEPIDTGIFVRTYERGVEDETYSCGTGVTAAALAYHHTHIMSLGNYIVDVKTKGGLLAVSFNFDKEYNNIWLIGPAVFVYEGEIVL